MNLRVSQKAGDFLTSWTTIGFWRILLLHGVLLIVGTYRSERDTRLDLAIRRSQRAATSFRPSRASQASCHWDRAVQTYLVEVDFLFRYRMQVTASYSKVLPVIPVRNIIIKFKFVLYSSDIALDIRALVSGHVPSRPEVRLEWYFVSSPTQICYNWHVDTTYQVRARWTVDPGSITFQIYT
jgi:hypothetical protein